MLQVLGNAVRIERVVPSVEAVGAEAGDDHLFEEFADGRKLAERAHLAEALCQYGVFVRVRQPGDDAAALEVDLRVRQGLVLLVRHGGRVVGLPVQRVDDVSVRPDDEVVLADVLRALRVPGDEDAGVVRTLRRFDARVLRQDFLRDAVTNAVRGDHPVAKLRVELHVLREDVRDEARALGMASQDVGASVVVVLEVVVQRGVDVCPGFVRFDRVDLIVRQVVELPGAELVVIRRIHVAVFAEDRTHLSVIVLRHELHDRVHRTDVRVRHGTRRREPDAVYFLFRFCRAIRQVHPILFLAVIVGGPDYVRVVHSLTSFHR